MKHLIFVILCYLMIFSACGGDSGGAEDNEAPAIVSSNPADGAVKVSVLTKIDIVFSESLDPVSVSNASVILRKSDGKILCTVEYNDSEKTVTISPSTALYNANTYSCVLTGIKDRSGNEMPSQAISFSTYMNTQEKYVFYSGGIVSGYVTSILDDKGRRIQRATYNGAGTDATWFTADDTVKDYETNTYDADDNLTTYAFYNGAGTDTEWFTSDDSVDSYSANTFDANGYLLRNINFNGDDIVSSYYDYLYDQFGNITRMTGYYAGTDGTLLTDDDVINYVAVYSRNADGNMTQYASLFDEGADSTWFTTDDVATYYYPLIYDENGFRTRYIRYSGAGDDGIWFNSDDFIQNYEVYVNDANGNMTRRIYYSGAGSDGEWFTNDDVIGNYYDNTYNENGLRTFYVQYSDAGTDTIWFNSDDVKQFYSVIEYDENGNQTKSTSYGGAGTDSTWFNGDDVKSGESFCDTTR